jgi:hypothetical protein
MSRKSDPTCIDVIGMTQIVDDEPESRKFLQKQNHGMEAAQRPIRLLIRSLAPLLTCLGSSSSPSIRCPAR